MPFFDILSFFKRLFAWGQPTPLIPLHSQRMSYSHPCLSVANAFQQRTALNQEGTTRYSCGQTPFECTVGDLVKRLDRTEKLMTVSNSRPRMSPFVVLTRFPQASLKDYHLLSERLSMTRTLLRFAAADLHNVMAHNPSSRTAEVVWETIWTSKSCADFCATVDRSFGNRS